MYYLQSRYYDPEVGRFINGDEMFDEGTRDIGYNLYAYCANNPVMSVDPDGNAVISLSSMFIAGAIFVVTCILLYYVNTPAFQRSWNRMCNDIVSIFTKSATWVTSAAQSIARSIGKSFARARVKPKYRSERETHHIVAQKSPKANIARSFLKKVNISVNDEINLIFLKTGLHRRLHTNQYYSFVNGSIKSSYDRGKTILREKRMLKTS